MRGRGQPLVLAERHAPLGPDTFVRLAGEQDDAGRVTVAVYVERTGAQAAEPVLRIGPTAAGELARGLVALAGVLGGRS